MDIRYRLSALLLGLSFVGCASVLPYRPHLKGEIGMQQSSLVHAPRSSLEKTLQEHIVMDKESLFWQDDLQAHPLPEAVAVSPPSLYADDRQVDAPLAFSSSRQHNLRPPLSQSQRSHQYGVVGMIQDDDSFPREQQPPFVLPPPRPEERTTPTGPSQHQTPQKEFSFMALDAVGDISRAFDIPRLDRELTGTKPDDGRRGQAPWRFGSSSPSLNLLDERSLERYSELVAGRESLREWEARDARAFVPRFNDLLGACRYIAGTNRGWHPVVALSQGVASLANTAEDVRTTIRKQIDRPFRNGKHELVMFLSDHRMVGGETERFLLDADFHLDLFPHERGIGAGLSLSGETSWGTLGIGYLVEPERHTFTLGVSLGITLKGSVHLYDSSGSDEY